MILAKTINKTRSAVLAVSAAALTIAAPAALVSAHGVSGHSDFGWGSGQHQTQVRTAASYSSSDPNQKNNGSNNRDKAWQAAVNRWHQTCDQKQTELNSQAAAIKAADQKRLNGQNILYGGVQNYVSTNGVTVANYDTLNAQVATDQTNATNDVSAITAPNLNCDNTTPTNSDSNSGGTMTAMNGTMNNQVKAFEHESTVASQALATYRHDLANLFNAVLDS